MTTLNVIAIPTYFLHYGRAFRVVGRTQGPDFVAEANAIMQANPTAALLHCDDERKVAVVADRNDLGRPMGSLGRVLTLDCCCCGSGARGRQWHNRDHGYGLCVGCIDYCARGETVESFESCYGLRGIHFDIE